MERKGEQQFSGLGSNRLKHGEAPEALLASGGCPVDAAMGCCLLRTRKIELNRPVLRRHFNYQTGEEVIFRLYAVAPAQSFN